MILAVIPGPPRSLTLLLLCAFSFSSLTPALPEASFALFLESPGAFALAVPSV